MLCSGNDRNSPADQEIQNLNEAIDDSSHSEKAKIKLLVIRMRHEGAKTSFISNSLFRSEERIATEKRYLKRKWKAHIRLETYKSQDRVAMDATRRQSVKL
jgi:hypothetical protein